MGVGSSARASARQRDAKSVAAADMAATESLAASGMRRVGTRIFHLAGEVWTDAAMKSELQVYKVKAYSRSYFTLVERIPELKEAFTIGDRVIVAGRGVAIEVVADGAELAADDLEQIVRKF